jgi:hypothetical protein
MEAGFPWSLKVAKERGYVPDDSKIEIEIKVERAPGVKCPRCWNYHTIQGNPMDVCDRCVLVVTQSLPSLVADGRWTEADAQEWRDMVQASVNRWKAKT